MDLGKQVESLMALRRAPGRRRGSLVIGPWEFRLSGLDGELSADLARRWGGFLRSDPLPGRPCMALELFRGGEELCLPPARKGEVYRIEARFEGGMAALRSYSFAACLQDDVDGWRIALHTGSGEPPALGLENAVRCLVARTAVQEGGFAMHGAGVLRGGSAYVFAGKSGSGKTTAVSHSAPCEPLGDDFALTVPTGGGWAVPAVPFDNSGVGPADPTQDLHPLAGIWRLFQDSRNRLERPSGALREASLLACVTYPATVTDLMDRLVANIRRFGAEARYEHLHFRPDPGFWELLRGGA